MSDSEYEDFGSGDESLDEIETNADYGNACMAEDYVEDLDHEQLNRTLAAGYLLKETRLFIERLTSSVKPSESVARAILLRNGWNKASAAASFDKFTLCDEFNESSETTECEVCGCEDEKFLSPSCGHGFCLQCWKIHASQRLQQRLDVCCMARDCPVLLTETAIKPLLSPLLNKRLDSILFDCYIVAHPRLRFCPGPNCDQLILAKETPAPKRVTCRLCHTSCCFMCGLEFHAPTECTTIKQWLRKCTDDSETANYISANTKDCPKCDSCIEKSGGCNHMLCSQCGYDFCWMCHGPWKEHGAQYYECSKFKEEGAGQIDTDARVSLTKYLHYFQRWENHCRSLKLEAKFLAKLEQIAQKEVAEKRGTWIDWEHVNVSGKLLAKCRYTLKYTYPKAYFMAASNEKDLFEYQQGILEAECEDLAWKLERANEYSIAELKQSQSAASRSRLNLVKAFL